MTDFDDTLAEALSRNGTFDPKKAKEVQQNTLDSFEAKMRTVERFLFGYLCICTWLFVFAMFQFLHSSSTKALLFYGLLMLVFFETTILMKLFYWIANNKISVLRALKELELGLADVERVAASSSASKEVHGPLRGLTRLERAAWWIVIAAGAAFIGAVKNIEVAGADNHWGMSAGGSMTSKGCVTIDPDGSGSSVTEISVLSAGTLASRGFNFHAPKSAKLRFSDGRGRELPYTTAAQNSHVRYDVTLPRPVMPGHRYSYTRTQEGPQLAKQEDGIWTYASDYSYGYNTVEFGETIVLPEGAAVVGSEPWPVAQWEMAGRTAVRFEAIRGPNEPFGFALKYRLASPPRPN